MKNNIIENEISFKLNRDDVAQILSIFQYYLLSLSKIEDCWEVKFIKKFVDSIFPSCCCPNIEKTFIEYAKNKRIEHIEWLFGSDNCGEPQFKLPKSYEEMKKLIQDYDMDWLGH